MSKTLIVSFESGLQHELEVEDAEFSVFPPTIPEGEENEGQPHPLAGKLSSYKIETLETSDLDLIWYKLDQIVMITLTK